MLFTVNIQYADGWTHPSLQCKNHIERTSLEKGVANICFTLLIQCYFVSSDALQVVFLNCITETLQLFGPIV